MKSLYIIIPAYNESDNIREVIREWYPVVEKHHGDGKSRLVIIDDGSKDTTYQIVKEEMEQRPLLEGLTKQNSGHAPTCMFGYRYALEHGADYVFQTDSDGQTKASEFEMFWKVKNKYDVVMGFRRQRGDGFSRLFVSRTLRIVIKKMFHVNVLDANVPYRLMKADVLKQSMRLVPTDYILGNVVLSVVFVKKNYRVRFLPISFVPRQGGASMYNWGKIWKIGRNSLKEFASINQMLDAGQQEGRV
jgi:Glycosyltransferases involved in cell wall biogenesis